MKLKTIFLLLLIFGNLELSSQMLFTKPSTAKYKKQEKERNKKIDSLVKINFLARNYKYLDKNFNPNISEQDLERVFIENKNNGILKNKRDTIFLILKHQIKDEDELRIALLRITYSWERLGFYTWQTADEAKKFASIFNINHPYKMYEFLCNENNKNIEVLKFLINLQQKSEPTRVSKKLRNRKKLFDYSWRKNPNRQTIAEMRHYEMRSKTDSLKAVDFLSKKYNFLDKNYSIKISKEEFEKRRREFSKQFYYPKSLIKSYPDSLYILMLHQFKNWKVAGRATRTIIEEKK